MELKLRKQIKLDAVLLSFNRTFMELKPAGDSGAATSRGSFNRTFMELKHHILPHPIIELVLLIAPLWN